MKFHYFISSLSLKFTPFQKTKYFFFSLRNKSLNSSKSRKEKKKKGSVYVTYSLFDTWHPTRNCRARREVASCLPSVQKRFNAASTLATLVTDRKRTCGVRRLDNGRPQKWLAAFEYPEIFDCLSINDGERSASTRDHLRYFASSLLPRIPPLPFLSSRGKGTDRCLQILHFEYFIVSGQLGISFNTFRWSGWNTGSTCFPKKRKRKTVIKCSIVVRRDVLVESNLLAEKCQTISIKELHFFNGIEHFWKLIWRDNFSLNN